MREINRLSIHQWLRSAIPDSQQPISPIGFLFLKLPQPPCAVLLVNVAPIPIRTCPDIWKSHLCFVDIWMLGNTGYACKYTRLYLRRGECCMCVECPLYSCVCSHNQANFPQTPFRSPNPSKSPPSLYRGECAFCCYMSPCSSQVPKSPKSIPKQQLNQCKAICS